MNWTKLGLVYTPTGTLSWARTHAWLPAPARLDGNRFRIFIGTRDSEGRTHTGYVDWDANDPATILGCSGAPVISPGPAGHFDESGALPSCLVEDEGRLLMYYTGRSEGRRRPIFYSSIGLAISYDGGHTFSRGSAAPIMERSQHDPTLVASPCVLREPGRWRMWYVSGLGWEEREDGPHSRYHVKYAESDDGVNWSRDGQVSLELKRGESNIARPCVMRDGGVYRAWYPYDAGQGYRIGYAESEDGVRFTRLDHLGGLDVSPAGWDSKATCYPWVVRVDARLYMLYNGNDFGREGFGIAVAKAS